MGVRGIFAGALIVPISYSGYTQSHHYLELNGWRLGSYSFQNEEMIGGGAIKMKVPYRHFEVVNFHYNIDSRLEWFRFEPSSRRATQDNELEEIERDLLRQFPFLVKTKDGPSYREFMCNDGKTRVNVTSGGISFSDRYMPIDSQDGLAKSCPITNLLGVAIGTPITQIGFPVQKLKHDFGDYQYRFKPVKTFRSFSVYLLKVQDGRVAGVMCVYLFPKTKRNGARKKPTESLDGVVDILKKKYGICFVREDGVGGVSSAKIYSSTLRSVWYRGLQNDYTLIRVQHEKYALLLGDYYQCIWFSLEDDVRRRNRDADRIKCEADRQERERAWREVEEEKRKAEEKVKYDGIDVL